jgi:hypothetical protein
MKDYYKILSIDRHSTAQEIQAAVEGYREIASRSRNGRRLIKPKSIVIQEIQEAEAHLIHPSDRDLYDLQLANYEASLKVEPYCDFAAIRAESEQTWQEAIDWDGKVDISLYRRLLDQTVKLPYPDIQENILLAALLTPSALANMLPIIFCCGVPGSGKSNIGKLALSIWGNNPMLASDTFSSIKRQLHLMAVAMQNGKEYDLSCVMVWDDISKSIMMQSPSLYALLKCSYSRKTSITTMAKPDTAREIESFKTFTLKVFSSVYRFYADSEFSELARRMLVIHCAKSDDADDLLDFDSVNWDGLSNITHQLWANNLSNCHNFNRYRKELQTYAKSHKPLPPDRSSLCKDVLATGLTLGIFSTIEDAYEQLGAFYQHADEFTDKHRSMIIHVVNKFIATQRESFHERGIMRLYILPKTLNIVVKSAQDEGVIDRQLRQGELAEIMHEQGWYLCPQDSLWYESK